jgi:regulatory protein
MWSRPRSTSEMSAPGRPPRTTPPDGVPLDGRRAVPRGGAELGPPDAPESVARAICLRLLDRRARTRTELADALRARGVPDDAAAKVLDRFTEVGLIDDAALADGYALAQHRERGLAGRAVALRLRQRGIAEEAVRAAVDQIDGDSELMTARMLVERRLRSLRGLGPQVQARRLVSLLARKGYSSSVAHQVVRECLGSDEIGTESSGLDL